MSWGLWGIGVPGPGERTAAHPSTYEADHPLGQIAANHPNVDLNAWESPQGIKVNMIQVAPEHQGKGYAGAALRDLISYADAQGLPIALTPGIPEGRRGMSQAALKRWYSSHGFVPNKGRNKDWNWAESMIRPARAHRTAMPTWYHLTDDPDFQLNPRRKPKNFNNIGRLPGSSGDLGRGVFLTKNPDRWVNMPPTGRSKWSGDRPYVADVDAPDNLQNLPGVWYDHDPEHEIFVPADQFHHLTVQQVRPRPDHRTASEEEYSDEDMLLFRPEHLKTPRWNFDRPVLPNGMYHFSPTEINPPSDAPDRPTLSENLTRQIDHPALPLDTPGVEWGEYDETPIPVDRSPTELHRGIKLDLRHPELGRVRRLLYGPDKKDNSLPSDSLFNFTDYESDAPVNPGSSPYQHPDLPYLLLDYLSGNDWHQNNIFHDDRRDVGLGRHWSTSLDVARDFVVRPDSTKHPDDQISLVLSGKWKGLGEDPYRRDVEGDFDNDNEITLLPGSPIDIHRVHFFDPHIGTWHAVNLHTPQQREAAHRTAMPAYYHRSPTYLQEQRPDRAMPHTYFYTSDDPHDVDWETRAYGDQVYSADLPAEVMEPDPAPRRAQDSPVRWWRTDPANVGKMTHLHDPTAPFGVPTKEARTMTAAVTVPVGSQHGLHTTPSMLISNAVKRTGWPVWFSDETGTRIDARDPLAVMSLGARHGAPITVHCDHPEIAAHIADYVAQDHD